MPEAAVAIAREILGIKLRGQAEVARLLGWADASVTIGSLAAVIARETDGRKALSLEAHAASIYWKHWEDMPVRFTRRNPQRLGPNGRWRPGRSDPWLTFGSRASQLTGKPLKATTPGNALLNYLYAVLETEMTIALLAVGLDPGIGIFHADVDGRSSLALDAIEAARPYVDCWLLAYLASSAFANRDFTEVSDGEVRLTHPLNSQLAHTAALWRTVCEPVASWLAHSVGRAAGTDAVPTAENKLILVPQHTPTTRAGRPLSQLQPPLQTFLVPNRGYRAASLRGRLKEDPAPRMCWECGRALTGRQVKFCSYDCVEAWQLAMRTAGPAEAAVGDGKFLSEWKAARAAKLTEAAAVTRSWEQQRGLASGRGRKGKAEREPLIRWYRATLQPHLVKLRPVEIERALDMSRSLARHIISGEFPHPRHLPALAKLASVPLPKGLLLEPAAALNFSPAGHKGDQKSGLTGEALRAARAPDHNIL